MGCGSIGSRIVCADGLSRLRALEAATAPGPWKAVVAEYGYAELRLLIDAEGFQVAEAEDLDGEYIAAMRNALPVLLDIAEKAQAMRTAGRGDVYAQAEADLYAALARLDSSSVERASKDDS